jgi:aspartyl-tRNA(Asn)/glutamyl-tRNA(Gln) amidotransferase subunit B
MEQGSLRCDANISVRPVGHKELGVKAEIKNMNSFRFIEKAVDYEIKRQIKAAKEGDKIIQETRLWNAERGITESMRSKEESHDYRYFPDPDLVPVEVAGSWVKDIRETIPELPDAMRARFISEYELSGKDTELLTAEKSTAEWFEEAVKLGGDPKTVSNWIMGELTKLLNEDNRDIEECLIRPAGLVALLGLIDKGTISGKIAKTVFEEMYKSGKEAPAIVEEKGLLQISDTGEIESIVDDIISKSPDEVERFKGGDQKLMGFFVGQVMKATKGKANPKIVNELIRKKLS